MRLIRDFLIVVFRRSPDRRAVIVVLWKIGRAFCPDCELVPQEVLPLGDCAVKGDLLVSGRDPGSGRDDPDSPDDDGVGIAPLNRLGPAGILFMIPAGRRRPSQDHGPATSHWPSDWQQHAALDAADHHGLLQPEGLRSGADAFKQGDGDVLFSQHLAFR